MKFLYLGFSSSDYMLKSFRRLCKKNNKVMMVFTKKNLYLNKMKKKNNKKNISIFELNLKNFVTVLKKIIDFDPDTVLISNYHSIIYRCFCLILKSKKRIFILCQDHYWTGSFKQIIGKIISKIYLHSIATTVLIPFKSGGHLMWAKQMSYKRAKTISPLYSADHNLYKYKNKINHNNNFIFIGRFESIKGLDILLSAYEIYRKKISNPWKLDVYGFGSLKDKIKKNKTAGLKIYNKITTQDKVKKLTNSTCLILPSLKEPFGMVVHEALCSGIPVIISENCGSKKLISENYNGFIFKNNSIEHLVKKMIKISNLNSSKILKLKKNSYTSSFKINNNLWSNNLINYVNNTKNNLN